MNSSIDAGAPLRNRAGLIHGLGMAAVIMTSFGFVWLGWGFGVLPSLTLWQWLAYFVVAFALFVVSAHRMIVGARLIKKQKLDRREYLMQNAKPVGMITAGEIVGCALVAGLAYGLHHPELVAPGIGLVVGLHFIPLARFFHVPAYFGTAAAMIVANLAAAFVWHGDAITAAAAIANGAILWVTAIYVLAVSRR